MTVNKIPLIPTEVRTRDLDICRPGVRNRGRSVGTLSPSCDRDEEQGDLCGNLHTIIPGTRNLEKSMSELITDRRCYTFK